MAKEKNAFVIYGKITGKQRKKGIAGLIVEALDKDLLVDDKLGSAVTDKKGNFEIVYDSNDFRELFFDQKPDIYLKVKNINGETIYTSEQKVKYQASRVEEFDIVISEELIEKVNVEFERLRFSQLVAVNPNYFGNITDKAVAEAYPTVFPCQTKPNMKNWFASDYTLKITCSKRS